MRLTIVIAVCVCVIGVLLYMVVRNNKVGGNDVRVSDLKNQRSNLPGDSITKPGSTGSNMMYAEKLNAAKASYPFKKWRGAFNHGLTQYTQDNCAKAQKIFDDLIDALIAKGENATEGDKVKLFEIAIKRTNALNDKIPGLIETGEREDLCELTNVITIACALQPEKYGYGEGLASEWRNW